MIQGKKGGKRGKFELGMERLTRADDKVSGKERNCLVQLAFVAGKSNWTLLVYHSPSLCNNHKNKKMSRKGSKSNFPELKSMKRLSKFPVVQQSVTCLNNFYEKAKEQNVERIHGVMDIASSVAKGVAFKVTNVLGRPIKMIDSILDRSLCFVELKIPAVHDPPNKIHEGIKNYIYTFWGGEMAFTMVERLAATFRHVMEIIFISSLDQNISLVRTMNAKSNSSMVKLVYSSVEVTLMTFGIIPEYLGKIFPADSSDLNSEEKIADHNSEERKELHVNNESVVSAGSGGNTSRGSLKGAEKNNDSPNHSKQQ